MPAEEKNGVHVTHTHSAAVASLVAEKAANAQHRDYFGSLFDGRPEDGIGERWPCSCSHAARWTATVDFPTPPLELAIAISNTATRDIYICAPACETAITFETMRSLIRSLNREMAVETLQSTGRASKKQLPSTTRSSRQNLLCSADHGRRHPKALDCGGDCSIRSCGSIIIQKR